MKTTIIRPDNRTLTSRVIKSQGKSGTFCKLLRDALYKKCALKITGSCQKKKEKLDRDRVRERERSSPWSRNESAAQTNLPFKGQCGLLLK